MRHFRQQTRGASQRLRECRASGFSLISRERYLRRRKSAMFCSRPLFEYARFWLEAALSPLARVIFRVSSLVCRASASSFLHAKSLYCFLLYRFYVCLMRLLSLFVVSYFRYFMQKAFTDAEPAEAIAAIAAYMPTMSAMLLHIASQQRLESRCHFSARYLLSCHCFFANSI